MKFFFIVLLSSPTSWWHCWVTFTFHLHIRLSVAYGTCRPTCSYFYVSADGLEISHSPRQCAVVIDNQCTCVVTHWQTDVMYDVVTHVPAGWSVWRHVHTGQWWSAAHVQSVTSSGDEAPDTGRSASFSLCWRTRRHWTGRWPRHNTCWPRHSSLTSPQYFLTSPQ